MNNHVFQSQIARLTTRILNVPCDANPVSAFNRSSTICFSSGVRNLVF